MCKYSFAISARIDKIFFASRTMRCAQSSFDTRSNKLLVTTETLDSAIAAAAAIAGKRTPNHGTSAPAASGISTTL